jgi:hypothetical protein
MFVFANAVIAEFSAPKFPILLNNTNSLIIKNWQISSQKRNLIENIELPMFAPSDWDQVSFRSLFKLTDSLQIKNLNIYISKIRGIASIKLNNIAVRHRLNSPTNSIIPIPSNLLNIGSENTLEIVINRPQSPEDGIPDLVKMFNLPKNLGICGVVAFIWNDENRFTDFSFTFKKNFLQFKYNLVISDPRLISKAPFAKIRCEEEILDPDGRRIHTRFEYLDLIRMNKEFSRSINIQNPKYWSADTNLQYTINLRIHSGNGLINSFTKKIGLKEFKIKAGKFYINNAELKIKGCTYRVDYPIFASNSGVGKEKDFYKTIRDDLCDIKELGFNAVRFPQDTGHPYCFNLADSLGLYLFVESGLWRIPVPYFKSDKLLQASKQIADEALSEFLLHPSFTAFGLGTEIPLHFPAVEKYFLILKRYIQQKSNIPLYIIPLNLKDLKNKPITDFYIYNKYDTSILSDIKNLTNHINNLVSIYPVWGNVGFSLSRALSSGESRSPEEIQLTKLASFFGHLQRNDHCNGYFIETYRDWISDFPSRVTVKRGDREDTYTYGLVDKAGNRRMIYNQISMLLNNTASVSGSYTPRIEKTNFFSISVFVLSIFFFFIYRRDYRFRENLKRSLSHPFGFFVDLRDRRIISIQDSTIIGIYTNFLVSSIIAAYLYFMRDNLLFEEHLSAILVPLNLKVLYISIIDSPLKISFSVWIFFYFMQLAVVIILKILNLFAVEKIRFRQYLATCNWAGAPLLFLLPASLLSYHLMYYDWYPWLAIVILGIFFFWYNFRLGNSLRVLLTMRPFKSFALLIITYGGAYLIFRTIYESKFSLITYFYIFKEATVLF